MSLENVLVTKDGICKIIDMGMCLRVGVNPTTGIIRYMPAQIPCGKKNYIAPEVIIGQNPFNPLLSDVWATGVMLFILVTGVPPMDSAQRLDPRYRMICNNELPAMLEQWGITLSYEIIDLLRKILRPNPLERLSLNEILAHPWMMQEDNPPINEEDMILG